jgi:hypothetical protein
MSAQQTVHAARDAHDDAPSLAFANAVIDGHDGPVDFLFDGRLAQGAVDDVIESFRSAHGAPW